MLESELVLSVSEVSRYLKLSRGSTYEAIRRGDIPSIRVGKRILVPCRALDRLLNKMNVENITSGQGSND